jgi:hypothetical protein
MMVVAMSEQQNEALLGLPETERQESEGDQIQGMAVWMMGERQVPRMVQDGLRLGPMMRLKPEIQVDCCDRGLLVGPHWQGCLGLEVLCCQAEIKAQHQLPG